MQPRPADRDVNLTRRQRRDRDVFLVQAKQAEKVHKITLDEPHGPQIGQLRVLEMQAAQGADLLADFRGERCQVKAGAARRGRDLGIAALELVLHLRTRELMQHHLHHGEFVKVRIEKAGDDHRQSSQCVKSCTPTRGV